MRHLPRLLLDRRAVALLLMLLSLLHGTEIPQTQPVHDDLTRRTLVPAGDGVVVLELPALAAVVLVLVLQGEVILGDLLPWAVTN